MNERFLIRRNGEPARLADVPLMAVPSFRSAVHIEAAVRWFDLHADELDADASRLWAMADLQCRAPYPACSRAPGSLLFS